MVLCSVREEEATTSELGCHAAVNTCLDGLWEARHTKTVARERRERVRCEGGRPGFFSVSDENESIVPPAPDMDVLVHDERVVVVCSDTSSHSPHCFPVSTFYCVHFVSRSKKKNICSGQS